MAKNLTIKGQNPADELKRYNALAALQKEAKTEELVKLQAAIKKPELREMLKYV
jgi:hypothetical protein